MVGRQRGLTLKNSCIERRLPEKISSVETVNGDCDVRGEHGSKKKVSYLLKRVSPTFTTFFLQCSANELLELIYLLLLAFSFLAVLHFVSNCNCCWWDLIIIRRFCWSQDVRMWMCVLYLYRSLHVYIYVFVCV